MLLNLNDDIHCSFYTKILLSTIYIQQGKIVKVEQNFQNVQQTIYSVRTYSCWICCLHISLQARLAVSNLTILISCYVVGWLKGTLNCSVLRGFVGVYISTLVCLEDWKLCSLIGSFSNSLIIHTVISQSECPILVSWMCLDTQWKSRSRLLGLGFTLVHYPASFSDQLSTIYLEVITL